MSRGAGPASPSPLPRGRSGGPAKFTEDG